MAERITGGIYKLSIPLPNNPLKNLNSYLILGRDRNLLIDTGFQIPACLEAMEAELGRLSVDMEKTDIFLTHMHADHSGLASTLATGSSKTYMSAIDAAILDPTVHPENRKRMNAMNISEGFPAEELSKSLGSGSARYMLTVKAPDFSRLENGDVLSYGGYQLECILTPGHTPGHMCLYIRELKLMFLGDHVLFNITPNIVRWPTVENSLKTYLEHLALIARYDINTALPAHRSVTCTVAERCASIAAHHKARLNEVLRIIRAKPGLDAYRIAGLMHWDIRCNSWDEFPSSQKFFAFGEALAHIDYLYAAGDITRAEKDGLRLYYPNTAS